jgi:hypothetical protein
LNSGHDWPLTIDRLEFLIASATGTFFQSVAYHSARDGPEPEAWQRFKPSIQYRGDF